MHASSYDLIILGGGCAGLSLGRLLATNPSYTGRIAILEARDRYEADRTWGFWAGPSLDPFVRAHIEHDWTSWTVASAVHRAEHASTRRPYAVVTAQRFYDVCLDAIGRSEHVEMRLGQTVLGLDERPDEVIVRTQSGTLRARHVVDARSCVAHERTDALMYQIFTGIEVERQTGSFDAERVELMTDLDADERGLHFSYVLPFSASRALIEATRFCDVPLPPHALQPLLDRALARRGVARARVIRREHGIIPLGLTRLRPSTPRIVAAGTMAGASRAATGYTFLRIQRWARACANALATHGAPVPHPAEPRVRRFMDHLFLQVLRERRDLAPSLFPRLADGLGADRFARFLSDEATPGDLLAVATSLPTLPFLRGLARTSRVTEPQPQGDAA